MIMTMMIMMVLAILMCMLFSLPYDAYREVTIKAIATMEGMADSPLVIVKIRILERTKPPHLELFGTPYAMAGPTEVTYVRVANFTWTCATPNATVLYHLGKLI